MQIAIDERDLFFFFCILQITLGIIGFVYLGSSASEQLEWTLYTKDTWKVHLIPFSPYAAQYFSGYLFTP
jgi:hypothetical protein